MASIKQAISWPLRRLLQAAGRVYVPGWHLDDALQLARTLAADEGLACTLGYFSAPQESPEAVARQCEAIVGAVAALSPPGYLSLKAPALGFSLAPLQTTLAAALAAGVRLHFDSHETALAEPTLQCLEQAAALGLPVGLTLPARWPRSGADAERALALGARPRLVKGEWADPQAPRADARAGFMALAEQLAGRAPEVAVATHDPALARQALQCLLARGTRCELELLHGMPQRAQRAVAAELGVPVRVYIPYGMAWRPYALAKAAENPRIIGWLLRDALIGAWRTLR